MEKRQFVLGEVKFDYFLTRKNVKNVNLRIKRDGSVYLSANNRVSQKHLDHFLEERVGFILKAKQKFANSLENSFNCVSGDKLMFFGEKYELEIIRSYENKAIKKDDKVYVLVSDDTTNYKRVLLDRLYKAYTQSIVDSLVEEVSKTFKVYYNVDYPKVFYRKLKSSWGNCRKSKGEIHFSIYLSKLPLDCIRYVVIHEFAHLVESNHSKNFYKVIENVLPFYKELQSELKKYR